MTTEQTLTLFEEFITRWKESGAAERANYQLFLSELCDLLEAPRPQPTQSNDEQNSYVLERAVIFNNGDGTISTGRIDLYKRSCFVLEAKQGSDRVITTEPVFGDKAELIASRGRHGRRGMAIRGTSGWDVAMRAARGQAEQLRPDYQRPSEGVASAFGKEYGAIDSVTAKSVKLAWPKTIPDQARAVRQALSSLSGSVTSRQLAKNFSRANVDRVEELLQTLVSLGQARETEKGRYIS